ncbi:MAG: hypothetical protein LQ349_008581 [Xanthoria aureola]|nr:MAG: hypothetical protein LQ349_008581 [Xanthoria aureola]
MGGISSLGQENQIEDTSDWLEVEIPMITSTQQEIGKKVPRHPLGYPYYFFRCRPIGHLELHKAVRCLVAQLVIQQAEENDKTPVSLQMLGPANARGASEANLDESLDILQTSFDLFGETFLILDGLDLCTDDVIRKISRIIQKATKRNCKIPRKKIVQDIDTCLLAEMKPIINWLRISANTTWPSDGNLPSMLAQDSNGKMFIGAATRLRQLGHLELSDAQDYLQSPLADVPTVVSQLWLSVLKRFPASAGSKYATAVHDTLSLLSVCKRSMTAGEIREGLIYDLHNSTWDNYLVNFQYEVWRLFPALLGLGGQLGKNGSGRAADNLYLVHPSLKEMLQSDSMRKGPLSHLAVDTTKAQQDIAERCVSHLLRYSTSDSYRSKDGWTAYAGKYWHVHVKKSRLNGSEDLTTKSLSLLDPQTPSFAHWIYMTKRDDEISTNASEDFQVQEVSPAPLYYAALLGLYNCALKLIRNGADVNARGGQHGSPLLAAVIAGEGELVELLAASADTTEINRAVLKAVELG